MAWFGGRVDDMGNYNGWADPWAAYIVLRRFTLVQFPVRGAGHIAAPVVPKSRLLELPDTPLRRWMIAKEHPTNDQPGDRDLDAAPAIAAMRPDFVRRTERKVFSTWMEDYGRAVPAQGRDAGGNVLVVTGASRSVATEEWWRALENPAVYGGLRAVAGRP